MHAPRHHAPSRACSGGHVGTATVPALADAPTQRPHRRASARSRRDLPAALILLAALALAALVGVSAPATAQMRAVGASLGLPVDGRVVHRFTATGGHYGPGHRGIDLAVSRGEAVRAAAAGEVLHAGVIFGSGWVTIDHGHEVTTTYGDVNPIRVRTGDRVEAGAVIGLAAGRAVHGRLEPADGRLHFGVKVRGVAVDPMPFVREQRWVPRALAGASVDVERGPAPGLDPALLDTGLYDPWDPGTWHGGVRQSPVSDTPGWLVPPSSNLVVGVPGLSTSTGSAPMRLTDLGYAADDVSIFSYMGLDANGEPKPYVARATWRGFRASAELLEQQLRALAAEHPGRAVDLVGHSMGGLVIMEYLLHHHDPDDPGLPEVDAIVTLATPHEGADLATGGRRINDHVASPVADASLERWDIAPTDSTAIEELAVGSEAIRALQASWREATGPDGWITDGGPRVLTIGGDLDPVVLDHRSDLPGAPHAIVPGWHNSMREKDAAKILTRAHLAGTPIPDTRDRWNAVLGPVAGATIGRILPEMLMLFHG